MHPIPKEFYQLHENELKDEFCSRQWYRGAPSSRALLLFKGQLECLKTHLRCAECRLSH